MRDALALSLCTQHLHVADACSLCTRPVHATRRRSACTHCMWAVHACGACTWRMQSAHACSSLAILAQPELVSSQPFWLLAHVFPAKFSFIPSPQACAQIAVASRHVLGVRRRCSDGRRRVPPRAALATHRVGRALHGVGLSPAVRALNTRPVGREHVRQSRPHHRLYAE